MSLINQVLSDLEKRGAGNTGGEEVRAVPRTEQRRGWLWGALALLLLAAAAGWGWKNRSRPVVPTVPAAVPPARVDAAALPAAQPVAAMASPPALPAVEEEQAPASRLSFELSSIPLPLAEAPRRAKPPQRQQAKAQPAVNVPAPSAEAEYAGQPIKRISPQQQAADEFGLALALIQQGRKGEAQAHLENALQLDPSLAEARRTLVGLLLDGKRNADAERVLQDGLGRDPKQPALAMLLARLQVERGALALALATLEKTLPFADRQADYHAFVAAVLQRQNRHKEAITHYQIALQLVPGDAVWWMGLGLSLQAVDRSEDARDAFKHAAGLHKLPPDLQAFVEQRYKSLTPPAK